MNVNNSIHHVNLSEVSKALENYRKENPNNSEVKAHEKALETLKSEPHQTDKKLEEYSSLLTYESPKNSDHEAFNSAASSEESSETSEWESAEEPIPEEQNPVPLPQNTPETHYAPLPPTLPSNPSGYPTLPRFRAQTSPEQPTTNPPPIRARSTSEPAPQTQVKVNKQGIIQGIGSEVLKDKTSMTEIELAKSIVKMKDKYLDEPKRALYLTTVRRNILDQNRKDNTRSSFRVKMRQAFERRQNKGPTNLEILREAERILVAKDPNKPKEQGDAEWF